MATAAPAKFDLDTPYPLTEEQIAFFRENGFIKLKQVLSPEVLDYYEKQITRKVNELNANTKPLHERDTYGRAFIQIGNLWQRCEIIREFVFAKRLARIATELMGCSGVRMYHDQALYKEPGGGHTPWHADQYYWPLDNDNSITAWIPLQPVPLEMGPLAFSAGSQRFEFGRDLGISDESEAKLSEWLKDKAKLVEEPFDLGEVSYHYGWTFHRAGGNNTDRFRKVMTIIYIDENTRVAEPKNKNQILDRDTFAPGRKTGEPFDTHMNPIMFSFRQQ